MGVVGVCGVFDVWYMVCVLWGMLCGVCSVMCVCVVCGVYMMACVIFVCVLCVWCGQLRGWSMIGLFLGSVMNNAAMNFDIP